jgi:5-methylcytosine-specific restriction endonuclease McrA
VANPSLAFGALAKPSRFRRDVKKHERRVETAKTTRDQKRQEVEGWREIVAAIFKRDQGCCRVCGRRVKPMTDNPHARAHTHHIQYRSAGGTDETTNLILLCGLCHALEHEHRIDILGNADTSVWIYTISEGGKETRRDSPCPTVDARRA